MQTLTPTAVRLLTESHGVSVRVQASVGGSSFSWPVRLVDGSIDVTGLSGVRRSGSAKIVADLDAPEADVFRTEWKVDYGLGGINGQTSWVPVGVFVVTKADEVDNGMLQVQLEDRWLRVENGRIVSPITTSGSTVGAIRSLVEGADSRIVCTDFTGSTATHPVSVWDRDRDKAVQELAKSIGAVVFFNPSGGAEIRPVPSPDDPVRWRVRGGDGGALLFARRGASQGSTYNGAVVIGEPPDRPPVRAIAVVDDASSPLLWGGAFSRRPRFYRTPLVTSYGQALDAAQGLLNRVRGVTRTLKVDTLPHPGLDADDVIEVALPNGPERHVVEAFSLPLGPGGISISTRTNAEPEGLE